MRYIEREIAVERLYGQGVEAGRDGPAGRGRARTDTGREGPEAWERDPAAVHASSAGAGQGYVERPAKLENGERVTFSFGTIGERFEDRVHFWEALERAEAHPKARVQHRLIVELPHEASPEARFEMVRRFCERFSDDKVPFWAALHAPGDKNDARNFHAHIVYSERPATRMTDPATGREVWDFEIERTYRKKSRNIVTSRPFRQDKLRSYHDVRFIKERRKDFANIVNDVLRRDGVKDAKGAPVLYDARSYKDMGVDAVPMRSINRIVADRTRDGATTVLDADYTRRMIAAELREAAARRDKDVLELVALDDTIRAATTPRRPGAARGPRPVLPPELRSPNIGAIPSAILKAAGDRILAARHEALRNVVMERATTSALERVIEATAPEAIAAAERGGGARDEGGKARPTPDAEAARLLREAAIEELAEVRAAAAKARLTARHRVGAAVQARREIVDAPSTTTSPATRRRLAEMERERAEAHGPAPATGATARAGASVEAGAAVTRQPSATRAAPASRPGTAASQSGPPRGAAPRQGADRDRGRRPDPAPSRPGRGGRPAARRPDGPIPTPAGLAVGLDRHALTGLSGGPLLDAVNDDVRKLLRKAVEGVDDASERVRRIAEMAQQVTGAFRARRDDAVARGLVDEGYAREVARMEARRKATLAAEGATPRGGTTGGPGVDPRATATGPVVAPDAPAKPGAPVKTGPIATPGEAATPPASPAPSAPAAPATASSTTGPEKAPPAKGAARATVQLDLGLDAPRAPAPGIPDAAEVETDDDRRRREREEDLLARKKKRKAVLGRRSRGLSR